MKIFFLDTNILIHFKRYDEIPWKEIFRCDNFLIGIPLIVVEELEKIKLDGKPRNQKRVRNLIPSLETHRRKGEQLKNGGELFITPYKSLAKIITDNDLDEKMYDDRIIASIIQYKHDNPTSEISLVADDLAMRIKASSRGIDVLDLEERFRLPNEKSPEEKELEELRRELASHKKRSPKLALGFNNGKSFLNQEIPQLILEPRTKLIQDEWHKQKVKYPLLSLKHFLDNPSADPRKIHHPSQREIGDYNLKLNDFHEEYKDFLQEYFDVYRKERMRIKIELALTNSGSVPATGIEIKVNIPNNLICSLWKDISYPQPPSPPKKPEWKSEFSKNLVDIGESWKDIGLLSPPSIPNASDFLSQMPELSKDFLLGLNVDIQKDCVIYFFDKLLHGKTLVTDPVSLAFRSPEEIGPFELGCQIFAENLPNQAIKSLKIIPSINS